MPPHNETLAEKKNKSNKDESEKVDINLYFGIFFDGTGANKFQMMLGKKFRRDKLFETYKTQLQAADADINNGHDILKHDRKYWEDKNIFTISELDQLYFDRDTEGRIEKRIIENCFANDDNNNSIGIASMPNDSYTTELLKKVATEVANEKQEDSSDYAFSLKGTMAEGRGEERKHVCAPPRPQEQRGRQGPGPKHDPEGGRAGRRRGAGIRQVRVRAYVQMSP